MIAFYKQSELDGYKHVHVFLNRNKGYSTEGRFQTEAEAKEIDSGIKELLVELELPFMECAADEQDLHQLLNKIRGK